MAASTATTGPTSSCVAIFDRESAVAFYAASFGSYNKSWGALSAVVITLVWLWLTSASLLFGAEINAEAERVRGKTEGEAAVL